jgi:hypothetical protein
MPAIRWLLLLLLIALLLTLSCSQGTSPFYPSVPNADLYFSKTGTAEYVVNGGKGTADSVLVFQFKTSYIESKYIGSLGSTQNASFPILSGRDSAVATWRNPNGTYGHFKGP